jgi:pimeloyl-ACP methyl ester carboxylesterase
MKSIVRVCLPMFAALVVSAIPGHAAETGKIVRTDHYVRVTSTAPSMAGQTAQLYVREVTTGAPPTAKSPANRVILFVHGAGTPAEVSFDVPYKDYRWMAYLANAGFDVFSMDVTGYGRSTRPTVMNDPCNAQPDAQKQMSGTTIPAPCAPTYTQPITTIGSDWDDINAVVDHLRTLRGVDKVALVGWSQGGPRTAGFTARHPEKVSRLVVLAPAYNRTGPLEAPNPFPPRTDGPMSVQSDADFTANWDRQIGCANQYEPAAKASVWSELLASDPVGATWGKGTRRAPNVPSWGFNQAVAAKMTTPFLMVAAAHDKQVPPERVRDLYADLGAQEKVIIDLGCASHNAMWESNHLLLFKASLEWLKDGTYSGKKRGEFKLGYDAK